MDARLQSLRTLLKKQNLDGIVVSSLPNIAYLTGYAGFSMQDRDAFLLVTYNSQYLFTHGIYMEDVKRKVKHFTLLPITRETPISTAIKNAVAKDAIKKLGFEAFDLKVSEYKRLIEQIDESILQSTDVVAKQRLYKSSDEINAIKKACSLGDEAFAYIQSEITVGITESELAAKLDFFIKSNGAENSFPTIVAFEENAAHPHHMPTKRELANNEYVLLDFGVLLDNYCSDMTRTISFGKPSDEKKKIYDAVKDAQEKAIGYITTQLLEKKPVYAKAADTIAREVLLSKHFPSMPHSLGHGIGLEVHEAPRLTPSTEETLTEGMVFSIEPGIYLPGECGVRIEDLFAIQDNKLVPLTHASRELLSI